MPDTPPPADAPHPLALPFNWRAAPAWLLPCSGNTGQDTLTQALALEALLPLVAPLEAWLGEPLRFGAAGQMGADPGAALVRVAVGRDGGAPWCELALPIDRLGEGALGPIAAGWALRWPRLACDLMIETWADRALDTARFEPGALLLLPGTFAADAAPWRVRLLARHGSRQVGARSAGWRLGERTLDLLAPPDGEVEPRADAWAAIAPGAVAVDAGHWFGGAAREVVVELDGVELRRGPHAFARGRLAPVGRGCGLLIDLLCADTAPAPLGATA